MAGVGLLCQSATNLREAWLDLVVEVAHLPAPVVFGTVGIILGATLCWAYIQHHNRDFLDTSASLQKELADLIQKAKTAERVAEDERAMKRKLERDLASALDRGAAQKEDLNACKEQLQSTQSLEEKNCLRAAVENVEIENQTLRASLSEASTKASRYESLLFCMEERAEGQQAELRERVSVLELKICDLESACAIRQTQLEEANAKLAAAATRACSLEAERTIYHEWRDREVSGKLTELIEATASLNDQKSQNVTLQQENKTLLAETKRLMTSLQDLHSANTSNEMDKRAAISENHKLRAHILEKSRAIQDSHENVTTLSNRCVDLERKLLKRNGGEADAGAETGGVVSVMDVLYSPMRPVSDLLIYSTSIMLSSEEPLNVPQAAAITPSKLTTWESLNQTHRKLRKSGNGPYSPPHPLSFSEASDDAHPAGVLGRKIHHLKETHGNTPQRTPARGGGGGGI